MGPELPVRGSKTSTVRNFFGGSKWFPVAIDGNARNLVISLWRGDKATMNGMAAWRLISPRKIPSAKIHWKSSRLDFLGSRRYPPHWLSSKGPNYQRVVLLISAGATEGHFEGKPPREGHQRGFVLARQCPGSPGTCKPEETGLPGLPMSWSPTLFSRSGPIWLPPVPWTEKAIERSPFFVRRGDHCCRGGLVGRTTFWYFFFFSFLQMLEQRPKKCIEFRGGVCWMNPEFGRCSLFPSWSG